MKNLAIFASGSGSNAEQITKYFREKNSDVNVSLILTNKSDAYVLERAKRLHVETCVFGRQEFYETDKVVRLLKDKNIDLVVLAGFLWLVPVNLLSAFPNRVINIHPALLPRYGGKGMYGSRVHEAVVRNGEKESGITIHLVDEIYDNGAVLAQEKCEVLASDTPEIVAEKVHQLEYEYFPKTIEEYLDKI